MMTDICGVLGWITEKILKNHPQIHQDSIRYKVIQVEEHSLHTLGMYIWTREQTTTLNSG